MDWMSRVQNLDVAVFISVHVNALGKSKTPSLLRKKSSSGVIANVLNHGHEVSSNTSRVITFTFNKYPWENDKPLISQAIV